MHDFHDKKRRKKIQFVFFSMVCIAVAAIRMEDGEEEKRGADRRGKGGVYGHD